MATFAPLNVLVEMTAIPLPAFALAKVPERVSVTASSLIIPLSVPENTAALVPSYDLLCAAAEAIVSALALTVST